MTENTQCSILRPQLSQHGMEQEIILPPIKLYQTARLPRV